MPQAYLIESFSLKYDKMLEQKTILGDLTFLVVESIIRQPEERQLPYGTPSEVVLHVEYTKVVRINMF